MDKEIAQKDLPRLVALAFGWYLEEEEGDPKWRQWYRPESEYEEEALMHEDHWQPHKNLSQIVRYGCKWLKGKYPSLIICFNGIDGLYTQTEHGTNPITTGRGTHSDERMADALCKVILKVAKENL